MYEKIAEYAKEVYPKCVDYRRDFHRYPETGWLEMRTSAIIAKTLTELGYEVLTGRGVCEESARMSKPDEAELREHAERVRTQGTPDEYLTRQMEEGFTGVVGILRCGEGPVVGLRFDIDALNITETPDENHRPNREGFASRNPGVMHACGHDGHASIGLGTAEVLMRIKDQLHGTVKLLFQPGEEGVKGARAMVAKGLLDDVDYFAGTHVAPSGGPDDGDVTPGTYGSLATAKYQVIFRGQAAHAGGFPEQGRSALLAAATAALNVSAIPRHSEGISRVNVGTLKAGSSSNVVPELAEMVMEVRGETTGINRFMMESAERICRAAADMYGCGCEIELLGAAESQQSDDAFIRRIAGLLQAHFPDIRVSSQVNARNWGSEDISLMMNRVQEHGGQAVYMRSVTPMASAQHTTAFDFNEGVLQKGVETFAGIVYDLLKAEDGAGEGGSCEDHHISG